MLNARKSSHARADTPVTRELRAKLAKKAATCGGLLTGPLRAREGEQVGPGRTRPPGPAVVPSECQQPMEAMMVDDPSLETQISAITDQIKKLLKERNELKFLDMAKYNRLQKKISRLHEQRDQLKKALTGNES